jgi:hypothetical protein
VLTEAGADAVHTGEGEVALAFIEDILERLAPPRSRAIVSERGPTASWRARP